MPDSMLNVDDWIVPLTAEQPRIVPPETAPPEVAAPVESPALKGRFVAHPRYRAWLAKCGVTSADVAYNLPGEVVSGHPDRHVVRVELYAGASRRRVYLKREHVRGVRSRWRNWLAGFGRVSRCEREAATLDRLERAGLAAPQWLAHGEDAFGRAFLIVDDVPDAIDLREFLQEYSLNEEDRRVLAERLGAAIAEFHLAGFGTPELCAKHVLIHPKSHAPTLIDWQSCGSPHRPTADEAHRSLAALHATLRGELAGPRERLRFLWAYRRVLKFAKSASVPSWREAIAAIEAASRGLVRKSSVRMQRAADSVQAAPYLVWLAGEAVVAVPELAADWPWPAIAEPYYRDGPFRAGVGCESIALPDGTAAELHRFGTVDPLGRAIAAFRERPWRSPGCTVARTLIHLARHGLKAPRLLAFGQRLRNPIAADSFVLAESPPDLAPIPMVESDRVGAFLYRLHAAGLMLGDAGAAALRFDPLAGDIALSVATACVLAKRPSASAKRRDLERTIAAVPSLHSRAVQRGYDEAALAGESRR